MPTARIALLFLMNFVVGWLVSQGIVPLEHADQLSQQLVDATGYLIIFLTSLATIVHSFRKPHPATQPPTPVGLIVSEVIKQLTPPPPASPIEPKINATPLPPQVVREKSSTDGWLQPSI